MPRVSVPGFVGPSNMGRSLALDPSQTINMYVDLAAPGAGLKAKGALLTRPGLRPYATVDDSPGRFCFAQDSRAFGVTGGTFWELLNDMTVVTRGTVVANSSQVSIVSNGTAGGQLLIVTGGHGYVFNLNDSTFVDDSTFTGGGFPVGDAQCCEFIDGYGIVLQRASRRFFTSALEDFTAWDALDVYERSEGSDNLVAVRRSHRELWFPGSLTGEVWYDNGDALTPFQPVPGVFLDFGVLNPMSFIRYRYAGRECLAFLGSDTAGSGMIFVSDGYGRQCISTPAVEQDIQQVTSRNFSWLFWSQQQGHDFLWLLLPERPHTWVFDGSTGMWFQWAMWNTTTCEFEPHLAQSYMSAFEGTDHEVSLILDRLSGAIYEMSMSVYDDAIAT